MTIKVIFIDENDRIEIMKAVKDPENFMHSMPADLEKALADNKDVQPFWEDITPLARNEFICWVENAKLIETRERRIRRTIEELLDGQRRPCCWPGCIHRSRLDYVRKMIKP